MTGIETPRPETTRRDFWLVAFAFTVTMAGTTLPTPLYPLYQATYGFSRLTITIIYATYAAGVLAALVLVGDLSDRIGRKRVLWPGLVAAAASAVCFLLARDLGVLLLGRLMSGISAGIFTGTATATLIDLAPAEQRDRAALVSTVATMGGLGLGPPLGGMVAEWLPDPLRLVYLLHLLVLVVAAAGLTFVAEPTSASGRFRLRPRGLVVPPGVRTTFVRSSIAGFAGFAVMGLFTAVAPSFLGEILGVTDRAAVGAVVMLIFLGSVVGQLLRRRFEDRLALAGGCATLIVAMVVLTIGLRLESLTLLGLAALVAGVGQGLSFAAAVGLVAVGAPDDQRAAVTSSLYLVSYVAISLPVVGVGLLAQATGLVETGTIFAVVVGLLALAAAASLAVDRGPVGDSP